MNIFFSDDYTLKPEDLSVDSLKERIKRFMDKDFEYVNI